MARPLAPHSSHKSHPNTRNAGRAPAAAPTHDPICTLPAARPGQTGHSAARGRYRRAVTPPDDPFGRAGAAAARLAATTGVDGHDVAVVLGSGWMPAADRMGDVVAEVGVADLGGFPAATVAGHAGVVRSIRAGRGRRVLAFLGRVHGYEGHDPATVVHGVRTAAAAGCATVVLTNAAGGIRPGLAVGQPVLVADHLNLTGASPVAGPLPAGAPPRFVDLSETYAPRLRALARQVEPTLPEGVYAGLGGPHYETPAEIRMLRALGADLVGMSTVWEAIAARHLGLEVLALSLVTNPAAGLGGAPLDHAEVLAAGRAAAERMGDLLAAVVDEL